MAAVSMLALMPIEHLQLPVFDWWVKAELALAVVVLTGLLDVNYRFRWATTSLAGGSGE